MEIKNLKRIIRKIQPKAYKNLRLVHKNNKMSHAYLIDSTIEKDLTTFAYFLISVIIADVQEGFGSSFDKNVKRLPNNYPDLHTIDGSVAEITKDSVLSAVSSLQKTPIEKNGKRILFLNKIENSTKHSLNALLKFFENPGKETYIIATTNNLSKVLSTIKSRCSLIRLNYVSDEKKIELLNDFFIQNDIKNKYLITRVFNDYKINGKDFEFFKLKYHEIIEALNNFFTNQKGPNIVFSEIFNKNENFKIVCAIFKEFFNDIWRINTSDPISFTTEIKLIQKYVDKKFNFRKAILGIEKFLKDQTTHCNFNLSVNQLCESYGGW